MSLLPDLPFEFLVAGTAISLQGSASSIAAWKQAIRNAAKQALPDDFWQLTVPLAVTIYIFPAAEMQGDIDNRIKPILDAMARCVYMDDNLIERIVAQKFEPPVFAFQNPTGVLASALEAETPMVYIRTTNDVHEELL